MLQKTYRLPQQTSFSKAKSIITPELVIKFCQNGLSVSRFGFVVSKRIDKRAVARNRLKRIIRAQIEGMLKKISPGYDMLFILRKSFGEEEKALTLSRMMGALKTEKILL